jgi:hypothetical protein
MEMVMNGNHAKIILGCVVVGFAVGFVVKRSFDSFIDYREPVSKPNLDQYFSRLDEFFITKASLQAAKEEFIEFVEMGFSPLDSFEITISGRKVI